MNSPSQCPAQNLFEWLDIATGELVPSAQARVRAEIEAHYAEAVALHSGNGLSEPEVQAAALADLGDAPAAAKRFQGEHLTTLDTIAVTLQTQQARSIGFLLLIQTIHFIGRFFPPYYPDFWEGISIFIVATIITITIFRLIPRKLVATPRRLIILLPSLAWLNVVVYLWLYYFNKTSVPIQPAVVPIDQFLLAVRPLGAVFLILYAAWTSYFFCFRLRNKLTSASQGDLSLRSGRLIDRT